MSTRRMYLVYDKITGKVIDFVPKGVQCFCYPCPNGETTTWAIDKRHWLKTCATNGWKP